MSWLERGDIAPPSSVKLIAKIDRNTISDLPQNPTPDIPQAAPATPPTARPLAPPTTPRPLPPHPSRWPTVIGIIGIVIGGLGVLANIWSVVSVFFIRSFMNIPGQAALFNAMDQTRVWMTTTGLFAAACAVVLLVGSVGVAQRRRWSVRVIFVWIVIRILGVPFGAAGTYLMQRAQFQAMASDPALSRGGAAIGSVGDLAAVFTVLFMVCWGWAFPIFMLVWFSIRSNRQETRGWR